MTVIISLSIPVTSIDGCVSSKKEGVLLYVEYVLRTPFAVWSHQGNVIGSLVSRQEIKIDVWKYTGPIIIGQYAVCGHLLDNHNRAHSHTPPL